MKGMRFSGYPYIWFMLLCMIVSNNLFAQESNVKTDSIFDPYSFDPEIEHPYYSYNTGPCIHLDEGHFNRHLYDGLGGFDAFRKVLSKDGYRVISFDRRFTARRLKRIGMLVIPCPQNKRNLWPNWSNPVYPAFNRSEVHALTGWVSNGGSLFLIVDHHPFPGAAMDLAMEFGFILYNGHAEDTLRYPSYFHRFNGTLQNNLITNGQNPSESVDSIITFNGSAMKIPESASPILTFCDGWVQWLPETAWEIDGLEPHSISGLAQGAYRDFGKGKVVVFADANMFSAQDTDWGGKMGFIDPNAKYNYRLLLNIIHYLDTKEP